MQFNKNDLHQLENIMRALRSGNFTMQGLEILAFADCMKWASKLHETIGNAIKLQEQMALNPQSFEVKGTPFKESPIKPIEVAPESTAVKPKQKKKV